MTTAWRDRGLGFPGSCWMQKIMTLNLCLGKPFLPGIGMVPEKSHYGEPVSSTLESLPQMSCSRVHDTGSPTWLELRAWDNRPNTLVGCHKEIGWMDYSSFKEDNRNPNHVGPKGKAGAMSLRKGCNVPGGWGTICFSEVCSLSTSCLPSHGCLSVTGIELSWTELEEANQTPA